MAVFLWPHSPAMLFLPPLHNGLATLLASVSREVMYVPWSNVSGAHVKIGTGGIAD